MAAIGDTLRQARLRSGLELSRVAETTKINSRFLKAIEDGDYSRLPGGVFARMFVKQYADALGLDGASFAEEFQRSMVYASAPPDPLSIAKPPEAFRPSVPNFNAGGDRARSEQFSRLLGSLAWVVTAILVCAGVYYLLRHLPKRSPTAIQTTAVPAKASAEVPPVPVSAPVNPRAAAASAAIEIAISAKEPVWVAATADGKSLFAETLAAGATKTIAATSSARLNIGNAGGLDVTFNGRKQEPFGPRGQIRNVEFTPTGVQVVSRTPPSRDPLL